MNVSAQIERLEALLAQVQQNAKQLHVERAAGATLDAAPVAGQSAVSGDLIESVAPEAVEMVSIAPEAAEAPPASAQRQSVPAPTESEPPSDIELELTEDLANTPSDEFAFDNDDDDAYDAPRKSQTSLEGLGASLGFFEPGSDGVPSSIGEAVERAATDGSVRTPPPESGPQATMPPPTGAHYQPELDEDAAPLLSHAGGVPTVSQLGTTVDLEPGRQSQPLELLPQDTGEQQQSDEFEAQLPDAEFGGGYHELLSAPPNAKQDLEGYDRAQRDLEARRSVPPPERSRPPPAPEGTSGAKEIYARPPVDVAATPALYEGERPAVATLSFSQRLDAALRLGR